MRTLLLVLVTVGVLTLDIRLDVGMVTLAGLPFIVYHHLIRYIVR